MKSIKVLLIISALFVNVLSQTTWYKDYPELKDYLYSTGVWCETDNGFICGNNAKGNNYLMFKVDKKNGQLLWTKNYSEVPGYLGYNLIKELADKNLLMAGVGNYPFKAMVTITDSEGNLLKQKIWSPGNSDWSVITDLVENPDQSYVISGYVRPESHTDKYYGFLVKLNQNLEIIWEKIYSQSYILSQPRLIKDGSNYVIAGSTPISGTYCSKLCLIKVDENGEIIWQKDYPEQRVVVYEMFLTLENNYLLAGRFRHNENAGPDYPCLLEINSNGKIIWFKNDYLKNDVGKGQLTNAWKTENGYGAFVRISFGLKGYCDDGFYLIKTDLKGKLTYKRKYEKLGFLNAIGTKDEGALIGGGDKKPGSITLSGEGPWIMKTDFDSNEIEPSDTLPKPVIPEKLKLCQNYPNPFNRQTSIEYHLPETSKVIISIYDIKGRKIKEFQKGFQNLGIYVLTWDGTNNSEKIVSSGVYIYQLITKKNRICKKMLFQK